MLPPLKALMLWGPNRLNDRILGILSGLSRTIRHIGPNADPVDRNLRERENNLKFGQLGLWSVWTAASRG